MVEIKEIEFGLGVSLKEFENGTQIVRNQTEDDHIILVDKLNSVKGRITN